jgi:hypothetical protein
MVGAMLHDQESDGESTCVFYLCVFYFCAAIKLHIISLIHRLHSEPELFVLTSRINKALLLSIFVVKSSNSVGANRIISGAHFFP